MCHVPGWPGPGLRSEVRLICSGGTPAGHAGRHIGTSAADSHPDSLATLRPCHRHRRTPDRIHGTQGTVACRCCNHRCRCLLLTFRIPDPPPRQLGPSRGPSQTSARSSPPPRPRFACGPGRTQIRGAGERHMVWGGGWAQSWEGDSPRTHPMPSHLWKIVCTTLSTRACTKAGL